MNISLTAGKKFTLQVHALPFLPLPLATGSSIMYVRPHFPLQGTRNASDHPVAGLQPLKVSSDSLTTESDRAKGLQCRRQSHRQACSTARQKAASTHQ